MTAARCPWADGAPEMGPYHDTEWGFPVHDDRRLFEKLCLEGFQSGLSWITILRKREGFRAAFAGFDPAVVSGFGEADIERLLGDAGIVRHRGKIEATINNAGRYADIVDEFGSLDQYVWRFEPPPESRPDVITWEWMAAHPTSAESVALSKDLKRRGWRFVGPTTVYAFMQAMGLVNDHLSTCPSRDEARQARSTP